MLSTPDLDAAFERIQASDAVEVVQEPTQQPYGLAQLSPSATRPGTW